MNNKIIKNWIEVSEPYIIGLPNENTYVEGVVVSVVETIIPLKSIRDHL